MFSGCGAVPGGSIADAGSSSNFNFSNVIGTLGSGLAPIENSMMSTMQQIQSNPNPSPQQLVVFQAQLQLYNTVITMESSVSKEMGDTMKSVVTNMNS